MVPPFTANTSFTNQLISPSLSVLKCKMAIVVIFIFSTSKVIMRTTNASMKVAKGWFESWEELIFSRHICHLNYKETLVLKHCKVMIIKWPRKNHKSTVCLAITCLFWTSRFTYWSHSEVIGYSREVSWNFKPLGLYTNCSFYW